MRDTHDGRPLLKSTIDLNQIRAKAAKRNSSSGLQEEAMVSERKDHRKSQKKHQQQKVLTSNTAIGRFYEAAAQVNQLS
jgi:hypothetical protein